MNNFQESMINGCSVMSWQELRFILKHWPVEWVNQLYIEMIDEQDKGYY